MRISELYIYPIKSLRPCPVQHARLRPEGVEHDRRFMLLKVVPPSDGGQTTYKPVQVVKMTEAALFSQRLLCDNNDDSNQEYDKDDKVLERQLNGPQDNDSHGERKQYTTIEVTYHIPQTPIAPLHELQKQNLHITLHPDAQFLSTCEIVEVTLMGSPGQAYRMGGHYDAWFTACLGYEAHLVYTGDFKRSVLAHLPSFSQSNTTSSNSTTTAPPSSSSWLSSTLSSIFPASLTGTILPTPPPQPAPPGIVYNECAPYLVTSRASLRDFSQNLEDGMDMTKFRPNIVLDNDENNNDDDDDDKQQDQNTRLQPWEEDYWAELTISSSSNNNNNNNKSAHSPHHRLELTANCGRCASINVDYATGRPAEGEQGTALKKLMKDRRVDAGAKYTPIFGRYAFLMPERNGIGSRLSGEEEEGEYADVHVGDIVTVTRRNDERGVWSWPKYE